MGDTLFVPPVVSRLAYNPLCLIRYIDNELPPDEWENVRVPPQLVPLQLLYQVLNINISNIKVSISFAGNEAVMSSAVLVINLDLCAFVRLGQPWFNTSRTFRWNFVDYR